jgi:hypothetical protein
VAADLVSSFRDRIWVGVGVCVLVKQFADVWLCQVLKQAPSAIGGKHWCVTVWCPLEDRCADISFEAPDLQVLGVQADNRATIGPVCHSDMPSTRRRDRRHERDLPIINTIRYYDTSIYFSPMCPMGQDADISFENGPSPLRTYIYRASGETSTPTLRRNPTGSTALASDAG